MFAGNQPEFDTKLLEGEVWRDAVAMPWVPENFQLCQLSQPSCMYNLYFSMALVLH